MNREIKFRAWDDIKKAMYYPDGNGYFFDEYSHEDFVIDGNGQPIFLCDMSTPTGIKIMQYTGLKDKNGKEIYEGDIINLHQFLFDGTEVERNHTAIVKYNSASFCLEFISGDWIKNYTGEEGHVSPIDFIYGLHEESFEIIGNIFENKDLLD